MALGDLHSRRSNETFRPRLFVAMWLAGFAFLLLISRLYTLQVLRGEELATKGRRNFVQQVRVPHDRGIIHDRNGRILVDNRPSLDLQVTPHFLGKTAADTVAHLRTLLHLEEKNYQRLLQMVTSRRGLERFRPIMIKRDLSSEEVEAIESERSIFLLDGVEIVEGRRRVYRYGTLAAHLLGYVNEIDSAALDAERVKNNPEHYEMGDLIGRAGVERTYEKSLRGIDGFDQVVVDAKGREQHDSYVETLLGKRRRIAPQPGQNIFLTIDAQLQERAEQAFTGLAGSVVALDPQTGQVLVMVSRPEYDPNLVSGALARDEKVRLDTDVLTPWINRPIQGRYAPGSTFKPVTALAALQAHVTTPQERVFCPGHFRLGRYTWRCHKDTGHGFVDLHTAMKVSCDTYFYTMASRMGLDPIADMARLLGLGKATGIPLQNEKPGIVPDEAYHNRVDTASGGYQRGMAINTAIGQGSLLVTPLQLAVAYASIANGNAVFKPQLVARVESADFRVTKRILPEAYWFDEPQSEGPANASVQLGPDEHIVQEVSGDKPTVMEGYEPQVVSELKLTPEYLAAVRSGLEAVVNEPGGTAYGKRLAGVTVAGKTGTAQVVRLGRDRLRAEEMDYFDRDHAWFAAYAPANQAEIVVVVINENSGHGGSQAAPIAMAVIDSFFELKRQRLAQVVSVPK